MKVILSVILTVCSFFASAQFGVAGYYNMNNASAEYRNAPVDMPYGNGYEVALNYWFRLPKKRIEFLPTVYHTQPEGIDGGVLDLSETGFQFKTNFYLFDFATDCQCPTFGKQGPQLQKGLFLQLSPGVAYYHTTNENPATSGGKFAPTVGGAIGLDIGLSSLLTLTPTAGVRFARVKDYPFIYTDEFDAPVLDLSKSRLSTVQLGLQLTFRLDKKRY